MTTTRKGLNKTAQEPKKRGRKSKYTPETVDIILETIRVGGTYKIAGDRAGIHADTFHQWMNTKPEFNEAVRKAEAESAAVMLAHIRVAAPENWQAAAWWLERRHNYIRRSETAITVPPEVLKALDAKGITLPDLWLALMQEAENVTGE